MSGSFADRFSRRHAPLAFALCLLAFLFAMEAKIAVYGPINGPGRDVRAAKALPAVSPEPVEHPILTPDSHDFRTATVILSTAVTANPNAPYLSQRTELLKHLPSLLTSAFFSPLSFFRPPPVR
jgi:hypothetical protein